ncbi:hypothetical protein ACGFNU_18710 [Spirillospora sp. NPDC048911]|uniref:hypothetical protein n=1 Tax=Spirillospora sp. NPDC048911 TaxID=3364527 RepID=UPI003713D4EF
MAELPTPDPDMVRAARHHLTSRYATGVAAVLWEMHKHPMHDLDAITQVLKAARGDDTDTAQGSQEESEDPPEADAMDVGAALLLLAAVRLDVDKLEAGLFDRALELGMNYEQIASTLDLRDAEAARRRHKSLNRRARVPADEVEPVQFGGTDERVARGSAAAQRAAEAAARTEQLERRRRDLRRPELDPEAAAGHAAAAARHESALRDGHGDAAHHQRQAAHHRRAARADRRDAAELAGELGEDGT